MAVSIWLVMALNVSSTTASEWVRVAHALDELPALRGLHACGELHVHLLRSASQQGCRHLAVAPCCYNRVPGEHYQALSTAAQRSPLQLSLHDLGLPLSETVTAGARVRHQRDRSMARRLGFDLLQREQRQCDEYLPTPSLPVAWLDKPFAQYCRDLAELRGLEAGIAHVQGACA